MPSIIEKIFAIFTKVSHFKADFTFRWRHFNGNVFVSEERKLFELFEIRMELVFIFFFSQEITVKFIIFSKTKIWNDKIKLNLKSIGLPWVHGAQLLLLREA